MEQVIAVSRPSAYLGALPGFLAGTGPRLLLCLTGSAESEHNEFKSIIAEVLSSLDNSASLDSGSQGEPR